MPKTHSPSRWKTRVLFIGVIVVWSALFIEVNFLAHQSKARWDLTKAKVPPSTPIYIYHIKPVHKKKVIAELKAMGRKNVKVLQEGKTYTF